MVAAATITPLDDLRLRAAVLARVRSNDPWSKTRRDNQAIPSGDWRYWILMAGRGFGKTRTGAETMRQWIQQGTDERYGLVGPTMADVRDVMVEGESGIIACCRRYGIDAQYVVSKRRVEFQNGAKAYLYSADEPNRLRGPQHGKIWGDELSAWRYADDAFANLDMGLRLGSHPQFVGTMTPRITKLVRDLVKRAGDGHDVVLTRGKTSDNKANLPDAFIRSIESRYAGTRLGRQELDGELLEDIEGALWSLSQIDDCRLADLPEGVSLERVTVAIDPAVTSGEESAETGIVVAARGSDQRGYVLADVSIKGRPLEWGRAAIDAFHEFRADHITPETNNGGDMVTFTLRTIDENVPVRPVYASRGKTTRAEPVSALYEQGRVSHVGQFPILEDQMTTWVPGQKSPDRMDALVWALTDVMLGDGGIFESIPDSFAEDLAALGLG